MLDIFTYNKSQLLDTEIEAVDTLLRMSMTLPDNEALEITLSITSQIHPSNGPTSTLTDKVNEKVAVLTSSLRKSARTRSLRVHWAPSVVDSSDSSEYRARMAKRRQQLVRAAKEKSVQRGRPRRASTIRHKRRNAKSITKFMTRLRAHRHSLSSDDYASTSDADSDDPEHIRRALIRNFGSKPTPFWDFDFQDPSNWQRKILNDLDLLIADLNAKLTYLEEEKIKIIAALNGDTNVKPVITAAQMLFVTDMLLDQVNNIIKHYKGLSH